MKRLLFIPVVFLLLGCATNNTSTYLNYEQRLTENMAIIHYMQEGLDLYSTANLELVFITEQFQDRYSDPEVILLSREVINFIAAFDDLTRQNKVASKVYIALFNAYQNGNPFPLDDFVERTDRLVSDLGIWYSLTPRWEQLTEKMTTMMDGYGFRY